MVWGNHPSCPSLSVPGLCQVMANQNAASHRASAGFFQYTVCFCVCPPGTKEIEAGVDEETGDIFLSLEACEISETSKFVWSKNYQPIGECPRVVVTSKGRT